MSMTNAERQAAYRARQKEKLESLRNSTPDDRCNVTDDTAKSLRNMIRQLQKENDALRNKPTDNGDEYEKLRHGVRWLKLENQRLQDNQQKDDTAPLRNRITKHEATIKGLRETVAKLKAFKAEAVDEWLPDEFKKERSKLKGARTRLRNDKADLDENITNLRVYERQMKSLTKPKVRLILNCLHPDKQPPENHDRYAKAFAAFNGAVP